MRWLLVVQPQQLELYRHLADRFRGLTFVQIVLDRRQGERRRRARRLHAERRGRERRQSPTAREREHWQLFGYRLVYRGAPLSPVVPSLRR
jgi:hypothetical protein